MNGSEWVARAFLSSCESRGGKGCHGALNGSLPWMEETGSRGCTALRIGGWVARWRREKSKVIPKWHTMSENDEVQYSSLWVSVLWQALGCFEGIISINCRVKPLRWYCPYSRDGETWSSEQLHSQPVSRLGISFTAAALLLPAVPGDKQCFHWNRPHAALHTQTLL